MRYVKFQEKRYSGKELKGKGHEAEESSGCFRKNKKASVARVEGVSDMGMERDRHIS